MLEKDVDEKYYLTEKMMKDISVSVNEEYLQYLKIKNATKKGYQEAYEGDSVNLAYPHSKTRRGRVGEQVSQTITTIDNMGVVVNVEEK